MEFEIAASSDVHGPVIDLATQHKTTKASAGDYGYLRPVLLQALQVPPGTKAIRVSVPHSPTAATVQVSRVEIRYGGTQPQDK
jgi:hypothetical protein